MAVPNFTGREGEYVAEVLASGYVGPHGPFVERFEEMVARASGRKWAVATITGTAALTAAAWVLGFNGRSINVPSMAFPAMSNVLRVMNCTIERIPETGSNHDEAFYGDGQVVCDRAPALGQPPTGADLECYSFAANKTVTCGHGGAVVGDNEALRDKVRAMILPGDGRPGLFNYRMADINAAVGCAQMERLGEFREVKRRIWNRYRDAGLPMIDRGGSRWMATMELTPDVYSRLEESGVAFRVEPFPGVSIPCSTGLTEADQDKVIQCLS